MRKIVSILVLLLLLCSCVDGITKIGLDRLNWDQSLPSGDGIIFSGTAPQTTAGTLYSGSGTLKFGDMNINMAMAGTNTGINVEVYKAGNYIYAQNSLTGEMIASGASPANDDSVLQTACNQGGTIFVHPGTYQDISITSTNAFTLVGANKYHTVLMKPTDSTCLDLDHPMITVENIQIKGDANNADSSGYAIDVGDTNSGCVVSNVWIIDVKNGVVASSDLHMSDSWITVGPSGGIGITIHNSNQYFTDVTVTGNYADNLKPFAGIYIADTAGVWFNHCSVWFTNFGTVIGSSGNKCSAVFFHDTCVGDYSTYYDLYILPDGTVMDCHFDNCWFGGVVADDASGKNIVILNTNSSVYITDSEILISDCQNIFVDGADTFVLQGCHLYTPNRFSTSYKSWALIQNTNELIINSNVFKKSYDGSTGYVDVGLYLYNNANVIVTSNIMDIADVDQLVNSGNTHERYGDNIPTIP